MAHRILAGARRVSPSRGRGGGSTAVGRGRPAAAAITLAVAVLTIAACTAPGATSGPSTAAPGATDAPGAPTAPVGGPRVPVVGTENFYADLLTRVGGTRVQVTSFIDDPNANPHTFESSPEDAAIVADAKLVIVNGLGYDDFMQQLLGTAADPERRVIDVQDVLDLPDGANTHVWYDPAAMPKVAALVTQALAALEPGNAAYFQTREQAYLASLQPIAAKIAALKATYAGTPIAFTEDVAGYLTQQIGLVVKTPSGFARAIEQGTDPAPADLAAEQDLLTKKLVKVLVYNSQVVSPLTQQIHDLAQQNGIPIVGFSETVPPTYPGYAAWQLGQLDALGRALASGS
jgi:zinc/manganese transport system substrate-binding protein